MARATTVTTSGTGPTSDWVGCSGMGDFMLTVTWAGAAGSTKIQHRALDSQDAWIDLKSPSDGDLDITANASYIVPGNSEYRLNVTTHTSAATLKSRKVSD